VALSLFAMLITLVNITHVSMWIDEAYSVTVATRSLGDVWRMIHNIDVVHSLFNVMLHPWLAIFGVSELSVRLPSTIAVGVATAGVVVLARRLAGPKVALASGLVFAVLPRVTWMGIEGRSYATTAAVAVWLTVLFVSLLRRPSWPKYVGYAVLGAFAGSLNIFLVLLLGAHGLTLLLDRRLRFRRAFWTWLVAAVVALAGAVPVLLTAVSQAAQIGPSRLSLPGYARSVLVNQWFLGDTPTIYLSGGGSLGDGPGSTLWKYSSVLLAAGCWLIIAYGVFRRTPDEQSTEVPGLRALLLSWLILPTAILVGYALVATPLYNPRYLTYGAPAVAILLGFGLVKLRLRWMQIAAVGLIIALALPVYVSQRGTYAKSGADWQLVARFVEQHRGPDQAVYFAPRTPPTSDVVGITSRTTQTIYPGAFAGMRDLTLVSTPAADANLLGRSQLLTASSDRLSGIRAVFVIGRRDYPAQAAQGDAQFLAAAGFRPGNSWTGPLNTVTEYTR
jgi:mannosyltransferase